MSKVAYFHEMSDEQFKRLQDAGTTWAGIMESFEQPKWCEYPEALAGKMGCWSLTSRMVTGEDYCKKCECYKESPQ